MNCIAPCDPDGSRHEMPRISDPLSRRAGADPDRAAVIEAGDGSTTTWVDLDLRTGMFAGQLLECGVEPGERVVVIAQPGLPLITALHACMRIGAALVPLSARSTPEELQRQIRDCDPRLVLAAAGQPEGMERTRAAWMSLEQFDCVHAESVAGSSIDESADACVIYTSASAGSAKGVRLTIANCIASARGCAEALGSNGSDDRWLLTLGTHRVGGLAILFRSVLSGAGVIVVPRFSESDVVAALLLRPTLVSLVPTMLIRLVESGFQDELRAPRAVLLGGAPAPAAAVREWASAGLRVCPSYGLSETGSQIAVVPPGEGSRFAGTAGMVHSQAQVRIIGDEIVVSGPVLSPGYESHSTSARAFSVVHGRREFRTGDAGSLTDEGLLTVFGRLDFTIITGGEKVDPEEVEGVLLTHPGVRDAAVRGSPDRTYGAVVEAIVVGEVDAAALHRWCADRLSPYKVPRRFRRIEALPRSDDGKLERRRLPDF